MVVSLEMLAAQFYSVVIVGLGLAQLATIQSSPVAPTSDRAPPGPPLPANANPFHSINVTLGPVPGSTTTSSASSLGWHEPATIRSSFTEFMAANSNEDDEEKKPTTNDSKTSSSITLTVATSGLAAGASSSTVGATSPSASERRAARDAVPFPAMSPPAPPVIASPPASPVATTPSGVDTTSTVAVTSAAVTSVDDEPNPFISVTPAL